MLERQLGRCGPPCRPAGASRRGGRERTSTPSRAGRTGTSSSRSASSNPRGTTTWPGDRDLAAVVLEGEAPQHVGLAAAGGVLEVEAVPVGEPPVAQVEELDVGGVARRRRRRGCRPSPGCGGRRPGARTGGGRPSAGCGSGRRPRTRAPPTASFIAVLEPPLERPHAARQELDHRVDDGAVVLAPRCSRRTGPRTGRCGSRGTGRPTGGPACGPSHGRYGNTRFRTSSVSRTFFALEYGPKYCTVLRCRSRVNMTRGYSSATVTAMYG